METDYDELRTRLSKEWNKPKKKNIKTSKDTRAPRDPKEIKRLQIMIAEHKAELKVELNK